MTPKDFSHIITDIPQNYVQYEFEPILPSPFAIKYLYYVLYAQQLSVSFPFYLECTAFNAYLVLYTNSGSGKLRYAHQEYCLTSGSIVFIDCQQPFRLDLAESSQWQFTLCFMNGNSISAYYETYHKDQYSLCPLPPISNIPSILEKLLECTTQKPSEYDFIASKLVTDLLTTLILAKDSDISHPLNLPKYLIQIKERFDVNYNEHFNLDELSEIYHVSKYKIIRDFTTYLNSSPINYLIDNRINASKKLLLETDYPIYEIASRVGIDNINHFTNLFKKSTGLTPNHYRKLSQIEFTEFVDTQH